MEVQFGPNSVDEPNLLYKLQRKIKVFNTANPLPNRGYNLIASSSKYGIVFIGAPEGTLLVYQLKELIDKECSPQHFAVKLLEKPTHIAVSYDSELLATTGGQALCIYKVADFQNANVSPMVTIKFDVNPQTFVSALQWNPCIPDNIAVAFFDGTLLVSAVNTTQVIKVQSKARCICWSPKGKQLVTGNSDGSLCQFKPDLTIAKAVPAPNLFEGAPVEALAIYWISTFQFAVVFSNAANNSRPAVTIVNTPKAGQPSCLNYEDICYSMGSNRPWYYYLQGLAQWNIIMASSSNSMEIATLGSADGANWLQWCQPDEARPELPLTDKKIENFPVGVCIDTCGIHQLPWGENDTLPHMPFLHVVSQSGLLTIFNVINLNKQAAQVCSPPQYLALPAAAMTSDIPDDAPAQVTLPPPPAAAAPKPQPPPFSQPAPTPQVAPPTIVSGAQFPTKTTSQSLFSMQPQPTQTFTPAAATVSQPSIPKPVEIKPVLSTPLPQDPLPKPQTERQAAQAAEVNAALQAEQERLNKMKADQELKSMLVKEVNDFQMELYKFTKRTREVQNKLQNDLNSINANFNFQALDTEQLKKDCELEDLRGAIVQLKLELVRACAVVAEARTQAEVKDLQQWTQADPLTTKRVASVKKLAYYVQTQLEQAHKALDYKWNEMTARDMNLNKSGHRMIRPILDDVYQPLVKQQEILSRQQAVLRTLRNTLKDCDASPMIKSTSLLRSTPFRNKDPLSKLTKNILNMSIEPQNNKTKEGLLTPQKLDALRDMLSNHKPTKIKPVNVELRQHLAQMRMSYQKSMKEKAGTPEVVKKSPPIVEAKVIPQQVQPVKVENNVPAKPVPQTYQVKIEPSRQAPPINIPSFTPVNNLKQLPGLTNVARTLFTEDSNKTAIHQHPIPTPPIKPPQSTIGFAPPTPNITASANTRSILKDMLQNKLANEAKIDANAFMGQKICSPSAFSTVQSTAPVPALSFTSKPISDINNMFNKFTPQTFASEPKIQTSTPRMQEETIEPEVIKPIELKKKEEKPSVLAASTQNVPDVLKISAPVKTEKVATKTDKGLEKSKENVPEKTNENITPVVQKNVEPEKKETVLKPLSLVTNKSTPVTFSSGPATDTINATSAISQPPKPTEVKAEPESSKVETPLTSSSASSLFAAANASSPTAAKPQPIFGTSSSTPTSPTSVFGSAASTKPASDTTIAKDSAITSTSASSIFASAAASQTFGKPTQSSSIFSSSSTSVSSVFGATPGSIFGTATTTQSTSALFGSATTQSAFSSAEPKSTVFSTPVSASPTSVFGTAVATTQSAFSSSAGSVFATTTQAPGFGTVTNTSSVFGSTATTTQSPTNLFGAATSTNSQSIFGSTTTTTQSVFGSAASPSIFGSAAQTTQSSVFGSPATTAQSVFGTATASTPASIFGSTVTTQSSSIFGTTTPASQPSVFGATTQASVFGSPSPATQTSVFGTPTATTQASVFGTPTQTTQASVFGAPPTTTASGSLFGGTENLFAAASISTTSAASPTTGGSIFGGGSPGSVFGGGSNTNVFGGKSTFGQSSPQATDIFGGGGATSFGQKPASSFWSGGNATAGSAFGSSGFGQQATTQSSSIFGGTTGGSFSSPSGGQPFGSPQPSSVFGSPQQQTATAFGGSPVFGSKPAFGQPAAFGSPTSGGGFGGFGGFNKSTSSGFGAPAAFGGGATFGGSAFGSTSPGKMFGSNTTPPSFASTQSNATFESLATQNTLTFGNLAQQSPAPAQQAPSFNTSPSFTGWRG